MAMQRVTFNTKSEYTAQVLQRKLLLSGIRLRCYEGAARFGGENEEFSQECFHVLQGLTVEVPAGMIPAAKNVLREMFLHNRYGIHSVCINGEATLSDQIDDGWWSRQFATHSVMEKMMG